MTDEQIRNEQKYQLSVAIAERMFSEGIISEVEFKKYINKLIQKYQPIFGTLWAGI